MRKTLFLAIALGMALTSQAKPRSLSQIRAAAQLALAGQAKAQGKALGSKNELKVLNSNAQTTIMGYDNGGFAVIANDDKYEAVLGYSRSAFSSNVPDGFKWWLNSVNAALASGETADAPKHANGRSVAKMLTTTWGQGTPYNNYCPQKYPSGCVATAATQIMYYMKYPETGEGNYFDLNSVTYIDFGATKYEWDKMLDDYNKQKYTTEQANIIATATWHVGVACKMNYAADGSGTTLVDAAHGLRTYFRMNKNIGARSRDYHSAEWMDMVYNELDNGRPILYGAQDKDGKLGHAFVFEGYDEDGKVYVNWGWDGSYDGYFDVDLLDPNVYQFSESQWMLTGFTKPDVEIPHASELVCYQADLKMTASGSRISVNSLPILNLNDYVFNGKVNIVLSGNGIKRTLGSTDFSDESRNIETYYGGNFSMSGNVPSDIPDGEYIVYLDVQDGGQTATSPLLYEKDKVCNYKLSKNGSSIKLTASKDPITTSIDSPAASEENGDGMVRVFNSLGQMVYSSPKASFNTENVPAHGLLIIKDGNNTHKVVKK